MAGRGKSRSSSGKSRSRRPARQLSLGSLLLAVLLIALAYFWLTGDIQRILGRLGFPVPEVEVGTPAPQPPTPASGDAPVQVYFTTPSLVYPDVTEQRVPPPFEQAIIADIDGAQASVDMATFEYNLLSVADALIRASERGVQVRLALDRESLDSAPMARWAGDVEQAQIPISWQESDAFLHSKFIIIDGRTVWMGSWNATTNDTYRNNNNLLRISIPAVVENYRAEFEQMFGGQFSSRKQSLTPNPRVEVGALTIENYFSPQDGVEQHILARLADARQSVRFLAFSYTADATADAMIEAAGRGVIVQGVMERRNAGGQGAELSRLRRRGATVLEDGNCYTMHHKLIIIDDRTVITGSYNFTGRAENTNDENLLIIDDPVLAGQYLEEFQRVYAQAEDPTRCES